MFLMMQTCTRQVMFLAPSVGWVDLSGYTLVSLLFTSSGLVCLGPSLGCQPYLSVYLSKYKHENEPMVHAHYTCVCLASVPNTPTRVLCCVVFLTCVVMSQPSSRLSRTDEPLSRSSTRNSVSCRILCSCGRQTRAREDMYNHKLLTLTHGRKSSSCMRSHEKCLLSLSGFSQRSIR